MLGVVNFPDFQAAMASAQHIVKLGPVAVELVDRTMIDLARQNPAFRPVIDAALVRHQGELPQAVLLVEFAGDDAAAIRLRLAELVELVADQLGLPGAVVQMTDERAQKAFWEVRKAGLNIMMSLRGDGKPVSFIEDCAVPLEHLAEYTDRLTEVFRRHGTRGTWYAHASVGTLHVRPILDMRADGPQGALPGCGRLPRRPPSWFADTKAHFRESTATVWCEANGWPGNTARGSPGRSRKSRTCSIPLGS